MVESGFSFKRGIGIWITEGAKELKHGEPEPEFMQTEELFLITNDCCRFLPLPISSLFCLRVGRHRILSCSWLNSKQPFDTTRLDVPFIGIERAQCSPCYFHYRLPITIIPHVCLGERQLVGWGGVSKEPKPYCFAALLKDEFPH